MNDPNERENLSDDPEYDDYDVEEYGVCPDCGGDGMNYDGTECEGCDGEGTDWKW